MDGMSPPRAITAPYRDGGEIYGVFYLAPHQMTPTFMFGCLVYVQSRHFVRLIFGQVTHVWYIRVLVGRVVGVFWFNMC